MKVRAGVVVNPRGKGKMEVVAQANGGIDENAPHCVTNPFAG